MNELQDKINLLEKEIELLKLKQQLNDANKQLAPMYPVYPDLSPLGGTNLCPICYRYGCVQTHITYGINNYAQRFNNGRLNNE